ncbi:MAG: PEP-CTERM sorting domain-containing protein [Gammaproteobacteria bacterium]
MNAGFETGDLTGWTVGTLTGIGSASVAMSNTTTYSPGTWGAPVTTSANEGDYMLVIGAGAAGDWQTVSQSLSLGAGEMVGGSAFFDWGDYWNGGTAYIDGAKVEILDALGALVATPWALDGSDLCVTTCPHQTGQAGAESGWQDWLFTSAAAGSYTVAYSVRNTNDGGGPNQTFGYFDAAQSVPEPATLGLLGLGLIGLGASRRRVRS